VTRKRNENFPTFCLILVDILNFSSAHFEVGLSTEHHPGWKTKISMGMAENDFRITSEFSLCESVTRGKEEHIPLADVG